ncbi:SCO2584 family spore wall biosynthesis protein [Streptomyces sp. NPDC001732]
MPDDVGGRPFPDGWEPDDDRGGADEDFASVVFDEDFVRAAEIHEPTAVERLLAAAQARAEAEASRARAGGAQLDEDLYDEGHGQGDGYDHEGPYGDPLGPDAPGSPYGRHGGALRPYRGAARWHRPVAWLLAVLMGIGMIALAFSAVYRNASGSRQEPAPPPATTGVDTGPGAVPSAPADRVRPTASATPRTG